MEFKLIFLICLLILLCPLSSPSNKFDLRRPYTKKFCPPNPRQLRPPTLQVKNKGEDTVVTLFRNSTSLLIDHSKLYLQSFPIEIKCSAPYPIEFLHEGWTNINPDTAKNMAFGRYMETEWNKREVHKREFSNFLDNSTYIFSIERLFTFGPFGSTEESIQCQAIENPCLQQTAHYSLILTNDGQNRHQLTLTAHNESILPWEAWVRTAPDEKRDCDAILQYKKGEWPISQLTGRAERRYEIVSNCTFKDGRVGQSKWVGNCESVSSCVNYYNYGQKNSCWEEKSLDDEADAHFLMEFDPNRPGMIMACQDPQKPDSYSTGHFIIVELPPEWDYWHFSGEAIYPEKMIFMEPFDVNQTLGSTVNVTCSISRFFGAVPLLFVLENNEGNFQFLPIGQYESRQFETERKHSYEETRSIDLISLNIRRIHCYGGLQRTYDWIYASRPINVQLPENGTEPSIFVASSDQNSTLIFDPIREGFLVDYFRQEIPQEISVVCMAFGSPLPKLGFSHEGYDHQSNRIRVSNETEEGGYNFIDIKMPIEEISVVHTLTCHAENIVGSESVNIFLGPRLPVIGMESSNAREVVTMSRADPKFFQLTIEAGTGNVSVGCIACGYPVPSISSWRNIHDRSWLLFEEGDEVQVGGVCTRREIRFPVVSPEISGVYSCRGENFGGGYEAYLIVTVVQNGGERNSCERNYANSKDLPSTAGK